MAASPTQPNPGSVTDPPTPFPAPQAAAPAASPRAGSGSGSSTLTIDEDTKRQLNSLDSGDIVLFNRRCFSMRPLAAVLCTTAKLFSNSRWDHVGIVVKNPADGELMFLEADFGGVKMRSLLERLKRSKSHEIAIRRLSIVRTDEVRQKMFDFAQSMLGTPYEDETGRFLNTVYNPLSEKERERLHAIWVDKRMQLEQINREIKEATVTAFQRRALLLEQRRIKGYISAIEEKMTSTGHESIIAEDYSKVFCSELVAATLIAGGLLDSYPSSSHYKPKDFSSEQANARGVYLLKGARYLPELFLRKSEEDESAATARKFKDVVEGQSPTGDRISNVRKSLKKSPIYNMIPDEFKRREFIKSFRAAIYEPGEIVFHQGEYSNDMFVLEEGTLERFISKHDRDPVLVSTLGRGVSFGVTAIMYSSPRSATIRAKERSLVWKIDRPTFEKFHEANDTRMIESAADKRYLRELLKQHFLFSQLENIGPEEVDSFFKVNFKAGETIFEQGDQADNFYIVKSGEVERFIRRPSKDGKLSGPVLVGTIGPGRSFGQLSLMFDAPRAATIKAKSDCELWALDFSSFHRLQLGTGSSYLMALFNKHASVERDGKKYMTGDDFLEFAKADKFPEKDRSRLSHLLLSLVTSNRKKADQLPSSSSDDADDPNNMLIDFWELTRFDIALNNPNAEMDLAFRFVDRNNSGYIDFHEFEGIQDFYSREGTESGAWLSGISTSKIKQIFGPDGSKPLMYKEFVRLSEDILPDQFRKDIQLISHHMQNDIEPLPNIHSFENDAVSIVGTSKSVNGATITNDKINLAHLISFAVSGALSRTLVAPLERIKILMQTDRSGRYRSITQSLRCIFSEEKTLRSLFRGNGSNILRLVPAVTIQLITVDQLRRMSSGAPPADLNSSSWVSRNSDSIRAVAVGGTSGIIAAMLTYPLDFAHGRMSLRPPPGVKYNTFSILRQSVQNAGARSLFGGLTPTLLGVFPYVGFSYAAYEVIRPHLPLRNDGSGSPSEVSAVVGGICAGTVGQVTAFPFDTCRRVMQVHGFQPETQGLARKGMADTMREILRSNGIRGLYRGITPNILKIAPSAAMAAYAYEKSQGVMDTVMTVVQSRYGDKATL